jgi:uncharacterized protein
VKWFVFLMLMASSVFAQTSASDIHLIFVNGLAEKMIEPNMIKVSLESWAQAPTAIAAQEQQATQYAQIKAAIDKFKIKKEDVQSVGYSVNPEYAYDQKAQVNRITGYRVSHTVTLTYRKIEDAGLFLDAMAFSKALTAGINVQSVAWDSDKKAAAEMETMGEAVKNARAKANELARAAGTEIRAVHRIQQTSESPPMARPMYAESAMMKMSSDAGASTALSAGLIKVRVEVQMEFEIQ